MDDGRNLALKTANLLEIDTRESLMVARSPSLWLVPQSRHRVYIEYPPNPLTLSSQAKVVGPKTESRSNPKAKSRSLTKPGLSKMREPSYCARGPNTGCS